MTAKAAQRRPSRQHTKRWMDQPSLAKSAFRANNSKSANLVRRASSADRIYTPESGPRLLSDPGSILKATSCPSSPQVDDGLITFRLTSSEQHLLTSLVSTPASDLCGIATSLDSHHDRSSPQSVSDLEDLIGPQDGVRLYRYAGGAGYYSDDSFQSRMDGLASRYMDDSSPESASTGSSTPEIRKQIMVCEDITHESPEGRAWLLAVAIARAQSQD